MDEVYKYITEHSTRQSEALDWVERQTNIRTNHARMLSGAVQGQFLRMIVQMVGAVRILELGTFTGYSSIWLASALPENGHLDSLEINDELEDLIYEGWERAGVKDRISLHIGDCRETLARFIAENSLHAGTDITPRPAAPDAPQNDVRFYDLAFIDANKREYCDYYSLVKRLVRPGGYILADNVLWDGKVCAETVSGDRQTQGILRFNETVAADPDVENVILPIRDGLSIIRLLK